MNIGGQGFKASEAIAGSSFHEILQMAKLVWGEDEESCVKQHF
jgi:hypothetical protein